MNADYADLIARATVYVVAESAGWVRGVLVLKRQDDTLWIETVAVHPDHQRHGLGRMLLQFAEQHARAAGLSELRLYTNEAYSREKRVTCGGMAGILCRDTGDHDMSTDRWWAPARR